MSLEMFKSFNIHDVFNESKQYSIKLFLTFNGLIRIIQQPNFIVNQTDLKSGISFMIINM